MTRGHADGRGTRRCSARARRCTRTPLRQLRQRRPDRRAEAPDILHRLRVVDGEAAADVEGVEDAELLAARRRAMSFAARPIASTCFMASAACEPTWKDRPRTPTPKSAASRARATQILRIAAELARQVAPPRRVRGRTPAAAGPRGRQGLRTCAPRRGCRRRRCARRTRARCAMSSGRLIGWVWMQRSGPTPRRRTSCTSPVVARSRKPPSPMMVCTTAGCGRGFSA